MVTAPETNARSSIVTTPGEQRAVCDRHAVADAAVVRDVAVRHQHVVVADARGSAFGAAAMDRHAFANDVALADVEPAHALAKLRVLRLAAEHDVFVNLVGAAHARIAAYDGVGVDLARVADHRVGVDDRVRADADVRAELSARIDDCGGMNAGHGLDSMICDFPRVEAKLRVTLR